MLPKPATIFKGSANRLASNTRTCPNRAPTFFVMATTANTFPTGQPTGFFTLELEYETFTVGAQQRILYWSRQRDSLLIDANTHTSPITWCTPKSLLLAANKIFCTIGLPTRDSLLSRWHPRFFTIGAQHTILYDWSVQQDSLLLEPNTQTFTNKVSTPKSLLMAANKGFFTIDLANRILYYWSRQQDSLLSGRNTQIFTIGLYNRILYYWSPTHKPLLTRCPHPTLY